MYPYGGGDDDRPYGVARKGEEVKKQAVEFLDQYYASIKQYVFFQHVYPSLFLCFVCYQGPQPLLWQNWPPIPRKLLFHSTTLTQPKFE